METTLADDVGLTECFVLLLAEGEVAEAMDLARFILLGGS